AIRLLRGRIDRYAIQCNWQSGQLQAAIKPRQFDALRSWKEELERNYAYSGTSLLDTEAVGAMLGTRRYRAGLFDANAGHLHTLNYVLGLAAAAKNAGARIYEESKAISIERGANVKIKTTDGEVTSRFAVLCGNAYLRELAPPLRERIMPVETYVI